MTPTKAPRLTRGAPDLRSTRPGLIALLLVVVFASASATTGATASAAVAAAVPSVPSCKAGNVYTAYRSYRDWSRSLLDPTFRLSSTYKPADLRSTSAAGLNGGFYVRRFVIPDLKAMAAAARAAGARLAVQSAFRSYTTQAATFRYWVRVLGYWPAVRSGARAGHSEHQLGTTIDLRNYGGSAGWSYTDWGTTRAGRWLKANAWKYGFVMTYPKGQSSVTCYDYEPWHFRYVGRAKAAKIQASGLTLREFLWRQQTGQATTPTPTSSPEPTLTPVPDPTTPTETPTPTSSPEPTPTPVPDPTTPPEPTPTETPTPTPAI